MKRIILATGALAVILTLAGCATERSTYYGGQHVRVPAVDTTALLTKADVIRMSQAKLGDGVIINMINASGSYFDLRSGDVVELADSGVSDSVINAMIATTQPSNHVEHAQAYYGYPPLYAYWYDPFWDPWYTAFYYGFRPRFYGPRYTFYAHGAHRHR